MISFTTKLFEEVDKPESSSIVSETQSDGSVERVSSWSGQVTGFNSFPSGIAKGNGTSKIFNNGISISNWEGVLATDDGNEITFIGKDINKAGKFYVLRTFFTNNRDLERLNGLMCILDGKHDKKNNSFVCTGYKLM